LLEKQKREIPIFENSKFQMIEIFELKSFSFNFDIEY